MSADINSLYDSVRPNVEAVAQTLFDASKHFLRTLGAFLPHGAVLRADLTIGLVGVDGVDGGDDCSPDEMLSNLHDALRDLANASNVLAVGIAEQVSVELPGAARTKAVKVLFEHRNGLTVALYLPFSKLPFSPMQFGDVYVVQGMPEVRAWSDPAKAES